MFVIRVLSTAFCILAFIFAVVALAQTAIEAVMDEKSSKIQEELCGEVDDMKEAK